MNCAWCEEALTEDELSGPYVDGYGDPLCDNCYWEEFAQQCPICEEYFYCYDFEEDGDVVCFLRDEGYAEGIYKIDRRTNCRLYRRVGDLTDEMKALKAETDRMVIALCKDCGKAAIEKLEKLSGTVAEPRADLEVTI